ncbi:MAG: hypothetical protein HZB46_08275 [Solirubrobacterales bacterium]|nr:hypothetical protein [Solirubrobacterales bacterium]
MTAVLVLVLALALPAGASARTKVAVGIGDQQAGMFTHPDFKRLKIRKARFFIRWDAMKYPGVRHGAEEWVRAARRAHVRPFLHISTDNLAHKKAKLLSTKRYRRDVGRLVRHFRKMGVRDWGVWNEANHKSQPTWRSPKRAAQYYRIMRSVCRGCTIVALDVLDQRGVERYVRRWFSALPRSYRRSKLRIGIHNYSDTNRKRSRGTRSIIRTVRSRAHRARFWLTETGGVVNFGRSFPCNERRAASRLSYMFRLAKRFDRYVERLYAYNWTGADCNGFDAGLTRSNGSLRPGYFTFRSRIRTFIR